MLKTTKLVTPSEYQRLLLVKYISYDGTDAMFVFDEPSLGLSKVQIKDGAYGQNDAFFMAHGNYHCLNTCNSWVGGAMKSGGMRTGWLTPMPKSMFLYLPEQDSHER